MASGGNSKQTSGNQHTLDQEEALRQAAENEEAVEQLYLSQVLPQSSPMHIPKKATITSQKKMDIIK